jgi:hypothetical protein
MFLPLFFLSLFQSPADAVLGRWEGTSTCVKVEWNQRCNDEVVRYDFVRDSTREGVIVLHAFKRVGTTWDSMGDLDVRFDSTGTRWVGEFSNSRVHIEWSYWMRSSELIGQLVSLPDRRKARDVVVHR